LVHIKVEKSQPELQNIGRVSGCLADLRNKPTYERGESHKLANLKKIADELQR